MNFLNSLASRGTKAGAFWPEVWLDRCSSMRESVEGVKGSVVMVKDELHNLDVTIDTREYIKF